MARKFFYGPTAPASASITSRLGVQGTPYNDTEIGKLVKESGDSGHVLCAAGDQIAGVISGVQTATADGYTIGGVNKADRIVALADGLQATPGTGTLAIGDQVVASSNNPALGTALATYPKVCKSTIQVGVTVPADLTAAAAHMALLASGNIWKVVSLGSAGTGAVGTQIVIARTMDQPD
jgi:hypothetical protein